METDRTVQTETLQDGEIEKRDESRNTEGK